jgi:uncharacterized protein (DUF2141 family)
MLVGASTASGEPPVGATVTASVLNLRAHKGNVVCRLYRSEADFPRSPTGNVRKKMTVVPGRPTRCTFENVAPGTYAMTFIHDENDNGKLDKNLLGMPTEGYGVSNNRTYATKAPSWAECKFVVERGKKRDLGIELRY